jgi:hypothetical protein
MPTAKKQAASIGALVSVELARALKDQFGSRLGATKLFRCPQCHQRLEVQKDHFEHVDGHGPCPLAGRKPE